MDNKPVYVNQQAKFTVSARDWGASVNLHIGEWYKKLYWLGDEFGLRELLETQQVVHTMHVVVVVHLHRQRPLLHHVVDARRRPVLRQNFLVQTDDVVWPSWRHAGRLRRKRHDFTVVPRPPEQNGTRISTHTYLTITDTSETMTLVVNNSLAIWRHFCLLGHIRQRRLWERLFKRRFINGLTYLLTRAKVHQHHHYHQV